MRPAITILVLAGVLVLVSGLAVGVLFSIDAGRPSWVLAVILGVDSLALVVIGACELWRTWARDLSAGAGEGSRGG